MGKETLALEMLKELKEQSRRWFIIALIELVIIVGGNIAWLLYESQYETVTEEQTITQEQYDVDNSNMTGVIN